MQLTSFLLDLILFTVINAQYHDSNDEYEDGQDYTRYFQDLKDGRTENYRPQNIQSFFSPFFDNGEVKTPLVASPTTFGVFPNVDYFEKARNAEELPGSSYITSKAPAYTIPNYITKPQAAFVDPKYKPSKLVSDNHYDFAASEEQPTLNKNCVRVNLEDASKQCYECKDNKTHSTYKYCSYSSERNKRYVHEDDYDSGEELEKYRFGPEFFEYDDDAAESGKSNKASAQLRDDSNVNVKLSNVVANHDGESCERLIKETMICIVCHNAKTGGKYEQCSYKTQPSKPSNTKPQYSRTVHRNSDLVEEVPGDGEGGSSDEINDDDYDYEDCTGSSCRLKRYASDDADDEEKESDPYEYVKSQSQRYYEDDDFKPRYQYKENPQPEKSSSELQSEKLIKRPGSNCKQVNKDGMSCRECHDPKTGHNFEQCEYSSQPAEKKYAYVNERKYNSNNDKNPKRRTKKPKRKQQPTRYNKNKDVVERLPKYSNDDADESKPIYYREFPENRGDDDHVKSVLAEFAKKDRSNCEKSDKNGMICYQCEDESGAKNEECMYVSESKPTRTFAAYHIAETKNDGNSAAKQNKTKPTAGRFYARDRNISA